MFELIRSSFNMLFLGSTPNENIFLLHITMIPTNIEPEITSSISTKLIYVENATYASSFDVIYQATFLILIGIICTYSNSSSKVPLRIDSDVKQIQKTSQKSENFSKLKHGYLFLLQSKRRYWRNNCISLIFKHRLNANG